eukprot:CCRYP_011177-RA/>CCRYP_011177-RA protein AED:0.01 eAED:0.01 QI:5/1/1/1/1/1/2/430/1361
MRVIRYSHRFSSIPARTATNRGAECCPAWDLSGPQLIIKLRDVKMAPDPIVGTRDTSKRQSSIPDDLSLSLSRSSSYNDFNQFLDNMLGLDSSNCVQLNGNSSSEREQLDDSFHRQWKFDLRESSAGGHQKITSHNNSGDTEREQAGASKAPEVIVVPLEQWNETESKTTHADPQSQRKLQQTSMLQKITVAFGIGKLLQFISRQHESPVSSYSWSQLQSLCAVDNFVVELIKDGTSSEPGWEVRGVDMIAPFLSVHIDTASSPSNCNSFESDEGDGIRGRHVVAAITSPFPSDLANYDAEDVSDSESLLCHLLGVLLHFLFSGGRHKQMNQHGLRSDCGGYGLSVKKVADFDRPSTKKKSLDNIPPAQQCGVRDNLVTSWKDSHPLVSGSDFSQSISILAHGNMQNHNSNSREPQVDMSFPPLIEFGSPSNLSQIVTNLVNCGSGLFRPDDSYRSLDVAMHDLQVLLREPTRFLFNGPPTKGNTFVGNEKLYGRSKEVASLTDAFCRVASSGESESIFVGGFSGCGKTRLVLSIFESVKVAGGYAVTRKFDEMQSSSPLAVVLSAFNELCVLVAQQSSQRCLVDLHEKLSNVIPFLTSVLPNVVDLLPCHVKPPRSNIEDDTGISFSSLCFTIQQLMRVISSPSRPVLLFLDDLQWADCMSLRLIQCVLSDIKGLNCMLFIGGFRDNEVEQGHILLEFFNTLPTFNIKTTKMSLTGINTEDVNAMISDSLGIFPRTCKNLSDIVYRKTNGNPYFALEFLRSLIDRNLISYSLRDKHWKWDINRIGAENITDNVLYILTNKMSVLEDSAQTALKVASCFGIHLSMVIAEKLAAAPQFHNLQSTLDQVVVKEGFMDFDGINYYFVHDKVREAAYGLIPPVEKDQYHFTIGMALQSNFASLDKEDTSVLFATIDQINRCPLTMFRDDSQRILIANLNYEAGMKAVKFSNFMPAHSYMNAAVSLLPEDSWKSHYDLSLKCNYHFAKAAYSCGYVDQAKEILEEVIEHGEGLEDKSQCMLDSYSLLVSLFYLARKDLLQAFHTCLKVLNLLGEDLPIHGNVDEAELISIVTKTKTLLQKKSNEDLLALHEETSRRNIAIMHFYDQLSIVSYLAMPKLCPYFLARWAHFSLTHDVSCKYTPGAFVSFSSMLCCEDFGEDARIACRIGKVGMLMLSRKSDAMEELPGVYLTYYAYAGSLIEPIQACEDMLRHAYEIGMQTGNPSKAAFILSTMVAKQIKAGTNLLSLKRDIVNYSKLAGQHAQKQLRCNLLMMNEIVSSLIGNENIERSEDDKDIPAWEECELCLGMMASFYLGHMERVYHKSKLWEEMADSVKKKVCYLVSGRRSTLVFFLTSSRRTLYSLRYHLE